MIRGVPSAVILAEKDSMKEHCAGKMWPGVPVVPTMRTWCPTASIRLPPAYPATGSMGLPLLPVTFEQGNRLRLRTTGLRPACYVRHCHLDHISPATIDQWPRREDATENRLIGESVLKEKESK